MRQEVSEDPVRARIARVLAGCGLFDRCRALVVACSGGGDSLALLRLLASILPTEGIRLTVAHLDHGARPESGDEAAFVARQAEALGLACVIGRCVLDPQQPGFEERARRARRAFLARVARARTAAVALGHTLEDQAETVLMNLARGAGRRGLSGMAPLTRAEGVWWLRPLLDERRETLRAYLRCEGVEWLEDASNRQLRFTRNRVRALVLPALEQAVPGASVNIARAAAILRQEEEWLERLTDEQFERLRRPAPAPCALAADGLAELPPALARRVIRRAIALVRGDLGGISLAHVDAVLERVLTGIEPARDLPGVRVRRRGGTLLLHKLQARRQVEGE